MNPAASAIVSGNPRVPPSFSASADALPGLIFAFRFHEDGSAEEMTGQAAIDLRHDGWLWLHFNLADMRACQVLRDPSGLPTVLPPAAAALLVAHAPRQQLHIEGGCVYGVFADLVRDLNGACVETSLLHFAMTERVLISGRRQALNAVEAARQRLRSGHRLTSVASLLELIIDHVVEAVDTYEDELDTQMDKIEEEMLGGIIHGQRQKLGVMRQTTVRLHRQLAGLRTLFHRIEKEMGGEIDPRLRIATSRLLHRLDGLDHDIIAMRDRAFLLQEEITMRVAEETNRHLQVLAIATAMFLPATLITGIFGMNLKGLPLTDLETGSLWVGGVLVGASVITYVILRRLGLFGR
jgi:zinc transporter